jgi:TolB-like protein
MSDEESIRPSEPEIREQLERILTCVQFAPAESARKLLRFVVEETLAGRGARLKEYTLATEVFGRDASFDPKTNPAVRVEASRLRRRLEHYYLTLGRRDPVLIEVPRGTYAPVFHPHADVLHLEQDLAELRKSPDSDEDAASWIGPLPGGPSIVVLPFQTLGGPDSVFGDGITVEIVTALSRFRELHLIGRSTAFRHRGQRDVAQLRAELGAEYVLSGSVRRAEDRVRVHAELSSGADGSLVWAEEYERRLSAEAIFEVQDEIAGRVVATIAQPHGVIARPELVATQRKPPERLDAYDCLLLFYDYAANRSPEGHARMQAALAEELRENPEVAALWAATSFVHIDTWRFGYNASTSREEARERGVEAARRAVKLDPLHALGYHALMLGCFACGDLKGFREAGKRCLDLNPNDSDVLADYGLHLTMSDEWASGMLLLKVALSLNPEPADWFWFPFFLWHFDQTEFDAALDMALRCRSEKFFWTHAMHAMAYAGLEMEDEAAAAVGRLLEAYPEFPSMARNELARWLSPERQRKALEALSRAGVPIAAAASGAG